MAPPGRWLGDGHAAGTMRPVTYPPPAAVWGDRPPPPAAAGHDRTLGRRVVNLTVLWSSSLTQLLDDRSAGTVVVKEGP